MTADVHGPGGVPQSVADVAACQTACIDDSNCVAIDWDPQNTGQECWILQVSYTGPTTQLGFIEHYALDRSALPVAPPASESYYSTIFSSQLRGIQLNVIFMHCIYHHGRTTLYLRHSRVRKLQRGDVNYTREVCKF